MPPPAELRRRGFVRGRGRTIVLVAVIAFVVLAMSLKGIATFYTDFLWFRSLGYTDVWRSVLGARVVLAFIFIGVFFVLCWTNLYIADRIAPVFRPPGPEEDLLEPYHAFMARRVRVARVLVSLLFAVIAGAGASSQWNDWILFNNRVDFGIEDPQFHRDIGFYVFQLPFLSFIVNWFFFSFVMILLITAVAHYLNGGIRLQTTAERVTPQVKAHLSLLLAALALIKVADYYLARFELTTSTRGVVDGATYTDVKVQLPALNLLMAISLLSFVLLIINIRRRGWQLPAVTVGLWAFVAIVAGNIYPAFVQRFSVDPAESSKERSYVERNIEFTRQAYGLDGVDAAPFDYQQDLSAEDVAADIENVRSARILDPQAMRGAFQLEQGKRTYYRFANQLDIDRYEINGKTTEVVIGARELNPSDRNGWENAHLAYTHGNGVALAPANQVNPRGRPSYLVREVPPVVEPSLTQDDQAVTLAKPQIYYGENLGGYAIVNTKRSEVDYTDDEDKEVQYRYEGEGGVELGSFIRRAAFAIRFGQIEPLISNFVSSDSRVIYKRDVVDRVKTIAPFLKWDDDPYPVLLDGKVVYIVDGFTTTNRYPYSQNSSGGTGALSGDGVNYVRNSVKAVVDAYEGSMYLYVMPGDDPIIKAYQKAFPNLFFDYSEMEPALQEHLRYPQDFFSLQTTIWARYHEDDPAAFLSASGRWSVAQDAPREVRAAPDNTGQTTVQVANEPVQGGRVAPYYAQLRLPGESTPSFVSLRTFVAYNTDDTLRQLTSFMVADSSGDPAQYGRLKAYEFSNTDAPGPAAVASNINSKQEVSSQISLLNQEGTSIEYGDLLLIPIKDSILYVRPLYVTTTDSGFPNLALVLVSNGEDVEFGKTLGIALDKLFTSGDRFQTLLGEDAIVVPPEDGETGEPPETVTDEERIASLVEQLAEKQQEQDDALSEDPPNQAAAGAAQDAIRELIAQLDELIGEASTTPDSGSSSSGSGTTGSGTAPTTTSTTTTLKPAAA